MFHAFPFSLSLWHQQASTQTGPKEGVHHLVGGPFCLIRHGSLCYLEEFKLVNVVVCNISFISSHVLDRVRAISMFFSKLSSHTAVSGPLWVITHYLN